VKAFPSLHTGLSVLAALYARKVDSRYANTVTALTVGIVFSTLYLGIHWVIDAVFAMLLVWVAYRFSQSVSDPQWSTVSREVLAGVRRYAPL